MEEEHIDSCTIFINIIIIRIIIIISSRRFRRRKPAHIYTHMSTHTRPYSPFGLTLIS